VKVAFLGNMNNNHFAMARYLRDRGVDADVLMFDNEPEHFHPSADSYDDSFASFCRTLTWGNPAKWARASNEAIARDLCGYQVIVGCGLAPAFCRRIGRPLDIFVPYGADLYYFTRYHLTYPNRILGTWLAVAHQRKGIPQSSVFHMDVTNRLYEDRWAEFRGNAQRWYCGMPMVYTGVYSPENVRRVAESTRWAREFATIRGQSDLLLFSHVRHVWGGPSSDPGQKGTDRLLEGLALFMRCHPGITVNLITFSYGTSIHESKALVSKLRLEKSVHWFPLASRRDLMCGILHADIVCSEFEHSWLSGGVLYEAMVMEKPIVGFRDDRLYSGQYPRLYPILNARTPESICARFEEYLGDPGAHRARGQQGRRWYDEFVVQPTLDRYMAFIAARGARAGAA
jgi:hypothetical protein